MNYLSIILFFFAVVIPWPSFAEPAKITLDQAIERALYSNRDIEIAKQRLVELEGLKGEVRAAGLPQLTGIGQYQRKWNKQELTINGQQFKIGTDNTFVAGVEFDQLLWDGGKVFKAVKAARAEKEKGLHDIRDVESQIELQVTQTFYQILYVDNVILVLKRQLAQLKDYLKTIKTRFHQGLESDYTLIRQEVEVSNVEPQLIDAERSREFLINGLKILLAMDSTEEISLEGSLVYKSTNSLSVGKLVEKAKLNRPDLLANRLREKSLHQNVGVEKAGYWPALTFSTQYQWQGETDSWRIPSSGRSDALTSSLNLSLPIFDGLKTYSRVKQAKARLIEHEAQTSQLEESIIRDVKNAYIALEKAKASYKTQEQSFALARKASKIAGERFVSGLLSQLELNDTINAQAKAEELYLQSIYECLSAEALLKKAVGGEL